jgi:hypothetical protein
MNKMLQKGIKVVRHGLAQIITGLDIVAPGANHLNRRRTSFPSVESLFDLCPLVELRFGHRHESQDQFAKTNLLRFVCHPRF